LFRSWFRAYSIDQHISPEVTGMAKNEKGLMAAGEKE
jgi:hypothetical protein